MYSNAVERPVSAQILPNIRGARVCANLKEYRLQAKTPHCTIQAPGLMLGSVNNAIHGRKIKETGQKIPRYIVVLKVVLFISDHI